MIRDAFDLSTSTDSADAGRAFEEAVHGLATHRPNTGLAIQATLRADPDHVAGHVLKGFANLILARSELTRPATEALVEARRALAAKAGGSADEALLVESLADAVDGSFLRAADRLDAGFADRPQVFLPFKISHALRFMAGDRAGMLAHSERAAGVVSPGAPAAGFIYGCYAFCLEEAGDYDRAMRMGRAAVRLQPQDAWGLHAVSHVFEMRGDTGKGIVWLEDSRPAWSRCNNFSFHMAWHLALLHLERGDHDRVLALYDDEVRPQPTDDFRDMANAVSLLWRLNRMGVHVGTRWDELAHWARTRQSDTTLVFAALHNLAALVAVGDWSAVQTLVSHIERKATGAGDQARVAAEVGVPLARMLAGFDAPADRQALDRLMLNLPKIGGSNAQRDFFVLALASALGRSGDTDGVRRVRHVRGHLKADDRLFRRIQHSAGMGLLA